MFEIKKKDVKKVNDGINKLGPAYHSFPMPKTENQRQAMFENLVVGKADRFEFDGEVRTYYFGNQKFKCVKKFADGR